MARLIPEESLLAEVEYLLRTTPNYATVRHKTEETLDWLARAAAVVTEWDSQEAVSFMKHVDAFNFPDARLSNSAWYNIVICVRRVGHHLRMQTIGPVSLAIGAGAVFDYFDSIRKVVEQASTEILFVDPYLDAEFVASYLPQVRSGVAVRLLTSDRKLGALLPALEAFAAQHGTPVSVRSANGLHDRYVFIDRASCYQSGASFKDGARNAPTTLTQITDAFAPVFETYERMWQAAKMER
jgi:hypothetical protein